MAFLEATKLSENASGGKETLPFPAAPKLVRCWGRERRGVQVWAAPSLLAQGPCEPLEGKPKLLVSPK